MKLSFHPEAALELEDAAFYYEDCQPGLGRQLTDEIESAIQLLLAHPQAWTEIASGIRRVLVRRFPFGLLYSIGHDEIYILAVMHLNREPHYWKNRLST